MSQSIRELITELAWIEDSIRDDPLRAAPRGTAGSVTTTRSAEGRNPDLVTLAEREREIITELRAISARFTQPLCILSDHGRSVPTRA